MSSGDHPGQRAMILQVAIHRTCGADWVQVDEVVAGDFARAGSGFWLEAAVFTVVGLGRIILGTSNHAP